MKFGTYLTSTSAPAASRAFLCSSASTGEMCSLTGAGAASTNFLASIKPKPVIAWTALMTWTLEAPAAFKIKETSAGPLFSSSSAGAAAATPTGAAAVTPNSASTALTC